MECLDVRANMQETEYEGTVVVAGIALAAAAFMLRFLIALLREGAPSVCYWVVPLRPEQADECCVMECEPGEDLEFLENEGHAEKEYGSGLISMDVRAVSSGLGCRSIYPRGGYIFGEHSP